jgi:hypothetical protein
VIQLLAFSPTVDVGSLKVATSGVGEREPRGDYVIRTQGGSTYLLDFIEKVSDVRPHAMKLLNWLSCRL